jgi:cytochrome c-type biogenesis protein CcsB
VTVEVAQIAYWLALTAWVAAFLVFLWVLVFQRPDRLALAVGLTALGLVPHTAGTAIRWFATERPPFISLYELVCASAWFVVAVYVVAQFVWRHARVLGVAVMPVAFLSMGAALTLSPEPNALGAALKSWWLVLHIIFALLAHGCFAIAFAAGILLLVGRSAVSPETESENQIPSPERLDMLGMRCIVFGFICDTIMVLSGSIWAYKAWGRYWGWDPIETWSLITWLLYGLYAHLRFLPGWRGRRAAIYAVLAFLVVVFSFWGVPHLWTSIHDYTLYSK